MSQAGTLRVDIRFRGLESSESLRAYILRRIHLQVRRLGKALAAVVVRLSDVNGPKGGVDKRCQVMLVRRGQGPVTIDEVSMDPYAAVDVAVERATLAAGRGIARERSTRRRPRAAVGRSSLGPAIA